MITGTWHGKINRQKVEVKIIQSGDSLYGTSYYYVSSNHFRRYSIKGFFDSQTNEAVWWDDLLIEEKKSGLNLTSPGKTPMLAHADFNCPGGGIMKLDGKAADKENEKLTGDVHLDKTTNAYFEDEWNEIIENYTTGGNDPELINEIAKSQVVETNNTVAIQPEVEKPVQRETVIIKPEMKQQSQNMPEKKVPAQTIEEKFTLREKVFVKEIPVSGDSIELRFYDNAEIDGDSISLFLNNHLIFQHIKLKAEAYTVKIAVKDLQPQNELTMVAENLGAIPPNTSYMVAIVGDKRYDAQLASTENSSAMIKLVKEK